LCGRQSCVVLKIRGRPGFTHRPRKISRVPLVARSGMLGVKTRSALQSSAFPRRCAGIARHAQLVSGIFVPRNLPHCLTFLTHGGIAKECVTSNFHFPKFTLIAGSNSVNSASLRCDHCRDELGSRVHHYWLMRFCSANCVGAYQKRLSPGAREKIVKLDVDHTSLKIAS
jgi:hypothetical protein